MKRIIFLTLLAHRGVWLVRAAKPLRCGKTHALVIGEASIKSIRSRRPPMTPG